MDFPELKDLEAQREAVVIPNEESIASFYKIRQQLKKLGDDMLVRYFFSLCCFEKFLVECFFVLRNDLPTSTYEKS